MNLRRLASRAYTRSLAPFGMRALTRALSRGLPPLLEPPLRALFDGATAPPAVSATIEKARGEIARSPDTYGFQRLEVDGLERWPVREVNAGPRLTSAQIAGSVSVTPRWGAFLHRCAEAFAPQTILEMGTCVGISGAYLASVASRPQLITLDGSADLARIAEGTLARVTDRATIVLGRFEETLAPTIARLTIDLAYVDGHHDGPATLRYVATLLPHLRRGALIILDDVRLYRNMLEAWRELSAMPGISASVDVGRFGLLVWEGGEVRGPHFDFSRYTGWWATQATRT